MPRGQAVDGVRAARGSGRLEAMSLLTLGHGALDADEVVSLLTSARVSLLVDVRRHPGSRRHPQFRKAAMVEWLGAAGVAYRWEEELGGRRTVPTGSPDTALGDALRGYAAHMRGPAFAAALDRVLAAAGAEVVAVCCAEADWRRCHRRLLADAVTVLRDVPVTHLRHDGQTEPHEAHPAARRGPDGLVYGAHAEPSLPGLA